MNSILRIELQTDAAQTQRLAALQIAFSQVCNALAPLAQQTACWNRVALHHMAYKGLRQRFPGIGSQMVCNAIYSVSRACRLVYQGSNSAFHHQRLALAGRPLPRIQFLAQAPVYFDRHTLSLKDGQISMFTLDGRMRFRLPLKPADEKRFYKDKLREIALKSRGGAYTLDFVFAPVDDPAAEPASDETDHELPENVLVIDGPPPAADAAAPLFTPAQVNP